MASPHEEIATAIVAGQHRIMGAVAWRLAESIAGVTIQGEQVHLSGDLDQSLNALIAEYSKTTGPLGVRMCYHSAQSVLEAHPEVRVSSFEGLV